MHRFALAALLAVAFGPPLTAADPSKPILPRDAPKAMKVPEGFKVTLFAGEPDIVQPIAFTFDDRGRMWVVECLSYPKWRQDGKGNDRVVILEDTDGDGTFDKKTVFLDDGPNLSGIELGFGGVWLCSVPNLLFVPIKDGEDKPAGPPQVVLDGWNIKDTKHNIFNSLAWGPDGWLYGCNGIQSKSWVGAPGTPQEKRTYMDCGVWRYHPTRKVFEPFAHGTTNPFGLDWDDHGELFITNCVIDHLFHFAPGGHYERMYGQDANPFTFGLMRSCVDYKHWAGGNWTTSRSTGPGGKPEHSDAGGGHAHAGCAIYLGDNFPAEYRNTLFTANIHGNRLNNDGLQRFEGGYKGVRRPDFLFANDSWFRGICVKTGPDGGLYVSDWCDTGECHNYDVADTTNGRIYRVVYGTPKPWKGDLSKLTDAELVELQLHKNDWFVRKARRILQERAAAGKLEKGTADALRAILTNNPDTTRKLRALWCLHAMGATNEATILGLLREENEDLRVWGIRLAADTPLPGVQIPNALRRVAAKEKSPFLLLTLAGCLPRMIDPRREISAALALREHHDEQNTNLFLMTWYALESSLGYPDRAHEEDLLTNCPNPTLRRYIARYLVLRGGPDKRAEMLGQLVHLAGRLVPAYQLSILLGIQDALAGVRELPEPTGWAELYPTLAKSESTEVRTRAEALAVVFGNKQAIADLTARITDAKADPAVRTTAIELLTRRKVDGLAPILQSVISDTAVRGAAIRALAAFPDDKTPAVILAAYPKLAPAEKADAVQTLASRPTWAAALLDALEKGAVPRADVSLVAARQILALNDKALAGRLETVWGKITPASKERAALVKKWKGLLTTEALQAADKANGRVLFAKHCATCHKLFGEGADVAPDLTGSQRTNLDYVLENVLDPSAVVPREYQLVNFTLADGRVISGIILRETPDGVTVRTVNDTVTLTKGDIESRKQTNQSIMPEGLLDSLKPEEVRDLIAYLGTPHQVPLPKK